MTVLTVIAITASILFFGFITYHQFRLIYYRYIYGYKDEMRNYLAQRNFELIETQFPRDEDWETSPYKEPPKFRISFGPMITINGAYITWSKKDYQMLLVRDKNDKRKYFWLEVDTTYFKKPELIFKEGRKFHSN